MTLDAPGVRSATAPAPPRDDSDRPTEAQDENLHMLEALLAESSAVSSGATGAAHPSRWMPATSSEEAARGEGDDPERSRPGRLPSEDSLADPIPGTQDSALQTASGTALEAFIDESAVATDPPNSRFAGLRATNREELAAPQLESVRRDAQAVPDESHIDPIDHAGLAAPAEDAGARAEADVSDAAETAGALETALLDEAMSVDDTGVEDASVESTIAVDMHVVAASVTASVETVKPENRLPGGKRPYGRNKTAQEQTSTDAGTSSAVLDDILLRHIAEAPSVSSDTSSSDLAGAAALATESRDAHAWTLRDRETDSLSEADPYDVHAADADDSPSHGAAGETDFGEPVAVAHASLEHAEGFRPSDPEDSGTDTVVDDRGEPRSESPSDLPWDVSWFPGPAEPEAKGATHSIGLNETAAATEDAPSADDAETGGNFDLAFRRPDLGGTPSSEAAAENDESLLGHAADTAARRFGENAGPLVPGVPGSDDAPMRARANESVSPDAEDEDADPEAGRVIALPGPGEHDTGVDPSGIEVDGSPGEPSRGSVSLAAHAEHATSARDEAAASDLADALLRGMAGSSISSDQVDAADTAAGIPDLDRNSDIDAGRSADAGQTTAPADLDNDPRVEDEQADRVVGATEPSEPAMAAGSISEHSEGPVEAGLKESDSNAGQVLDEHLDSQIDSPGGDFPPFASVAPGAESSTVRSNPGEASIAASTRDAAGAHIADDDEDSGSVICLPDLSALPPSDGNAGHDDDLLRQIAEVVAASAGEPVGPPHDDANGRDDDASACGHGHATEHAGEVYRDDERVEDARGAVHLDPGGTEDDFDPIGVGPGDETGPLSSAHATPTRDGIAEPGLLDTLLRDVTGTSVSSDLAGTPNSGTGDQFRNGGYDVDAGPPSAVDPALRHAASVGLDASLRTDESVLGDQARTGPHEPAVSESAPFEDSSEPSQIGLEDPGWNAEQNESLDGRVKSQGEAVTAPGFATSGTQSPTDGSGSGEAPDAASNGDAIDAPDAGESAGSVIHLPDLSGPPQFEADAELEDDRQRQTSDIVMASKGDAVEVSEPASPESRAAQASSAEVAPAVADEAAAYTRRPDDMDIVVPSGPSEADAPDHEVEDESDSEPDRRPSDPAGAAETEAATGGIVFDDTLALELADAVPISSDEGEAPQSVFDVSLPDTGTAAFEPAGEETDATYAEISLEAAPPGPAAALAFATDPDTEVALRDGLFGFGSASAETDEAQVWQGGLRAAIAALGEGRTAPLVIVDIDGVPYPAGAIHELAAVCEVGTVVIAVGSDVSARPGRELLLAGVSDYLAKPLTAEAVRGVATRALANAAADRPGGRVAGFVGCGGSGSTTMAVATALDAASRGCYVSLLDLSRSVAAAALALGVEPVAGLDQLLETADKVAVDSESLEAVRARRSDRIEVYAHRWSPEHPMTASADAVDRLLAVLRQRSQLVLVDGLDETAMRFRSSAEMDMRMFVAEPTYAKTPHLARMVNLLDGDLPLVLVQNHTRAFRRSGGGRTLRDAGIGIEPDVVVPFDPVIPETADRGWPQGRLPRSMRKPLAALTDRLLGASSGAGAAAAPASARAA